MKRAAIFLSLLIQVELVLLLEWGLKKYWVTILHFPQPSYFLVSSVPKINLGAAFWLVSNFMTQGVGYISWVVLKTGQSDQTHLELRKINRRKTFSKGWLLKLYVLLGARRTFIAFAPKLKFPEQTKHSFNIYGIVQGNLAIFLWNWIFFPWELNYHKYCYTLLFFSFWWTAK